MNEWLIAVCCGIAGPALVFSMWMYYETISGVARAHFERVVEKELRDNLRGKALFLVPGEDA